MSNPTLVLKTVPEAIFRHAADEATIENLLSHQACTLVRTLGDCIQRGKKDTAFLAHNFICQPRSFFIVPADFVEKDVLIRNAMLSDPDSLLNFLTGHYDEAAANYEDRLLGNGMGQYIHALFEWSVTTGRPLSRPPEYYQQYLERDSYWAIRLNKVLPAPGLLAKMHEYCTIEKDQHARAALYYLLIHTDEPVAPYQHLFNRDLEYAYLGLALLRDRGFSAEGIDISKLSPRWAYHFLMIGDRIPEADCMAALYRHPGWLAEYIVDSKKYEDDSEQLLEMNTQAAKLAYPHPLLKALNQFMVRTGAAEASSLAE